MEYYSAMRKKKRNSAICNNTDGPWGHYAKWDKSGKERQILYDITYMWNLKKAKSQKQRVEWWLLGAGSWGTGEMLSVQTCNW